MILELSRGEWINTNTIIYAVVTLDFTAGHGYVLQVYLIGRDEPLLFNTVSDAGKTIIKWLEDQDGTR